MTATMKAAKNTANNTPSIITVIREHSASVTRKSLTSNTPLRLWKTRQIINVRNMSEDIARKEITSISGQL